MQTKLIFTFKPSLKNYGYSFEQILMNNENNRQSKCLPITSYLFNFLCYEQNKEGNN